MNSNREACVAGKFYPGSPAEILKLLDSIHKKIHSTKLIQDSYSQLFGAILPHAGHIYSSYQTLPVFSFLQKEKTDIDCFIILHPLHNGGIFDFATDTCLTWETPLGKLALDSRFIESLRIPQSYQLLQYEHSAEVILPYLQYFGFGDKMIVPIGITKQSPDIAREISMKIRKAVQQTGRKVFIIASSDFSHFLSPEEGYRQDEILIQAIKSQNINSVYQSVIENNISACGYGPVMCLMDYALHSYQKFNQTIVARGHSGQVYNSSKVVDYISFLYYS